MPNYVIRATIGGQVKESVAVELTPPSLGLQTGATNAQGEFTVNDPVEGDWTAEMIDERFNVFPGANPADIEDPVLLHIFTIVNA